jgi:hypothetical protein
MAAVADAGLRAARLEVTEEGAPLLERCGAPWHRSPCALHLQAESKKQSSTGVIMCCG